MTTPATTARVLALILTVVSAASACNRAPAPEIYRVRGQVISVDGSGEDVRVQLAHEAIEGFKNRDGKPERMAAMTMAFGVSPGVDASAFAAGSKWDIAFDVVWGREPMIRISEAKRLPDDTALTLAVR